MKIFSLIKCLIFKHDYETYEFSQRARLVRCRCCDKRWIMDDSTMVFLRYDDDESFKSDLKTIHPELRGMDI